MRISASPCLLFLDRTQLLLRAFEFYSTILIVLILLSPHISCFHISVSFPQLCPYSLTTHSLSIASLTLHLLAGLYLFITIIFAATVLTLVYIFPDIVGFIAHDLAAYLADSGSPAANLPRVETPPPSYSDATRVHFSVETETVALTHRPHTSRSTLRGAAAVLETDLWYVLYAVARILAPFPYWSSSRICLLYTSPIPRDGATSRMPSSA